MAEGHAGQARLQPLGVRLMPAGHYLGPRLMTLTTKGCIAVRLSGPKLLVTLGPLLQHPPDLCHLQAEWRLVYLGRPNKHTAK